MLEGCHFYAPMAFPGLSFQRFGLTGLTFSLLLPFSAHSQGVSLESAGARFAFSAHERSSGFKQSEAFVNWNLPWSYEMFTRWHLQWRLDCTAGWLGGNGQDAAIF